MNVEPLEIDPRPHIGACAERVAVHLGDERRRDGVPVDPEQLPRAELQRVVHEEIGELDDPDVEHRDPYTAFSRFRITAERDVSLAALERVRERRDARRVHLGPQA